MSPLMPASASWRAATLPLPDSQEISEPASATSPFCLRSKMVWTTRTKSCGGLPPVIAIEVVVEARRTLASKSGVGVGAGGDQGGPRCRPIQRSRMSPRAPRGHEAVPSSVITLR
jgi:hypothetical protein